MAFAKLFAELISKELPLVGIKLLTAAIISL
jgi:hypothetical protein